uniref:Uncharacterized protein n=1 Tax=Chromera velia CCMP2878 TaxID=1169474 RepID=A0A0G4H8N5_9ALVE|eukprot:Cvel_25177.t1-p1 / transcript=Cvel_25177.t1 / gene=Cvel_25177 / organism=Chromera_velia_CCMP2878 / gene_product=hypothetical protein / transcript_product=hypothetical protein / location=Cvel_scaffold2818:8092-9147(+) / protein_length=352 / sequence_SO=supercontig / SO=protein_coding / is_pseudo=false
MVRSLTSPLLPVAHSTRPPYSPATPTFTTPQPMVRSLTPPPMLPVMPPLLPTRSPPTPTFASPMQPMVRPLTPPMLPISHPTPPPMVRSLTPPPMTVSFASPSPIPMHVGPSTPVPMPPRRPTVRFATPPPTRHLTSPSPHVTVRQSGHEVIFTGHHQNKQELQACRTIIRNLSCDMAALKRSNQALSMQYARHQAELHMLSLADPDFELDRALTQWVKQNVQLNAQIVKIDQGTYELNDRPVQMVYRRAKGPCVLVGDGHSELTLTDYVLSMNQIALTTPQRSHIHLGVPLKPQVQPKPKAQTKPKAKAKAKTQQKKAKAASRSPSPIAGKSSSSAAKKKGAKKTAGLKKK